MFRELTKKNKQISDAECIRILTEETRGVLSVLGDEDYPYGMPMNHFYDEERGKLYFHCGHGGHRLDALQRHDKVSFCVMDRGTREADQWAWQVKSVVVFGRMRVIDDRRLVEEIAAKLSRKFTSDEEYIQKEIALYAHETLLLELSPEHICGKLVTES